MLNFIKNFTRDEAGAVTVDWVIITASVVALSALAYSGISHGSETLSDTTGAAVSSAPVDLGSN